MSTYEIVLVGGICDGDRMKVTSVDENVPPAVIYAAVVRPAEYWEDLGDGLHAITTMPQTGADSSHLDLHAGPPSPSSPAPEYRRDVYSEILGAWIYRPA